MGVLGEAPRRRGERKTGVSRAVAWGKAFPLYTRFYYEGIGKAIDSFIIIFIQYVMMKV
jgi:hypothetical protein